MSVYPSDPVDKFDKLSAKSRRFCRLIGRILKGGVGVCCEKMCRISNLSQDGCHSFVLKESSIRYFLPGVGSFLYDGVGFRFF